MSFQPVTDDETGELLAPLVDEADLILPSVQDPSDTLLLAGIGGAAGSLDEASKPPLPRERISLPTRPLLRRDPSVPAPRQPPPPTPPPQVPEINGLSEPLSLQQHVRRSANEGPKVEPAPYAFVYRDADAFPHEIEEWFTYSPEEKARLAKTQSSFWQEWSAWNSLTFVHESSYANGAYDWTNAAPTQRLEFLRTLVAGLGESNLDKRARSLESLVYIFLGCWQETAGLSDPVDFPTAKGKGKADGKAVDSLPAEDDDTYEKSQMQLGWIRINTLMFLTEIGVQPLLDAFSSVADRDCFAENFSQDTSTIQKETEERESWCSMTLIYISLEVARVCIDEKLKLQIRAAFLRAKPNLLLLMARIINQMRWDDSIRLSLVKVIILSWKVKLLLLGGLPDVEAVKETFHEKIPDRDQLTKPVITTSPLIYHNFRQEISSKFPAYNPPPSMFPLEPEQKSILPSLRLNTRAANNVMRSHAEHGGSILHQPVHIGTPAPSPPPSPAGKAAKKQNYQTNQLFPFLYPPLDASSNELGGKGSTSLQDSLVGRKWTGTDIPTSILEATELFRSRVRATRALTQMWEARKEYEKYERGWGEGATVEALNSKFGEMGQENPDLKESRDFDGGVNDRLGTVEEFYRDGLPYLQSIVMVFLKTILASLTTLITQANHNGSSGMSFPENQNGTNGTNENAASHMETSKLSLEELDSIRTQEVTAKAASGMILLMLKWFKVSHVLKFEYLTQLLVDANFVPITLKLLQTQEMEKVVNSKTDRAEAGFFHICTTLSRNWVEPSATANSTPEPADEDDEDDAMPPPIKRYRDGAPADRALASPPTAAAAQATDAPQEAAAATAAAEGPAAPITSFSWRSFFANINYLRILQKASKAKTHRVLMLVTYKSHGYLRKALKVPQRELRLYTLKLFKSQVPYCGRKWRQTNMRVITGVYLHCRPELRDDWLLCADVDHDLEQSVALEQSLRVLTHYHNLRRYAAQMGLPPRGGAGADGYGGGDYDGDPFAEHDFFVRELERMDWGEFESTAGSVADDASASADFGWEQQVPAEHM